MAGIKKAVSTIVKKNGAIIENVTSSKIIVPTSASATWSIAIPDIETAMGSGFALERLTPGSTPTTTYSIDLYDEAGTHFAFTDLIPLSRELSATPQGSEVIISGADYSHLLFFDGITLETKEGKNADTISIELLSTGGISSYSFPASFGYPVIKMDIQRDRIINRIVTLLNEIGAVWRINGKQFVAWIPDYSSAPSASFASGNNLYTLRSVESVMELFDKVTVTRVSRNADLGGASEGTSLGRQYINLSGAFYSVHFDAIDDFGVTFSNIDWFYEGSYVGSGYNLGGPVDLVYFTVNASSSSYHWQVAVKGTPSSYLGTGVDLDAKCTKTLPGTEGEHPAPNIESNFTPTDEIAELKADAFLREQGSFRREITFQAPLTSDLNPSSVIALDEKVTNFTGNFNINSISYVTEGPAGWMEIGAKQYEI